MNDEQIERVQRAVKEAVREQALLDSPRCAHDFAPPSAIDSEELLISALLNGHTRLTAIKPLVASDFFARLHREIVQVLEKIEPTGDVSEAVVSALDGDGDVERAVFDLRDGVPYVLPRYIPEHVARVHDAARRRRLSAWLVDLNVEIRMGRLSADEALAKMRDALERARRAA